MTEITSIDVSLDSLEKARENVERKIIENVRFLQADIFFSPFRRGEFRPYFHMLRARASSESIRSPENLEKSPNPEAQ
jgi:hypothetical protein